MLGVDVQAAAKVDANRLSHEDARAAQALSGGGHFTIDNVYKSNGECNQTNSRLALLGYSIPQGRAVIYAVWMYGCCVPVPGSSKFMNLPPCGN